MTNDNSMISNQPMYRQNGMDMMPPQSFPGNQMINNQPNFVGNKQQFYSGPNEPVTYDNGSYQNFQRQMYATNTNQSGGN